MSKKSVLALSSACHLHSIYYPGSIFTPTSPPHSPPLGNGKSYHHPRERAASQRQYATTRDQGSPSAASNELPWPEMSTSSATPTPYQIFQLHKTEPYSKRRFYDLVKLYHPDRHGHCCDIPNIDCLSRDVKMKRYRLVVAANDILSDPTRRRAYDLSGSGWSGHPDLGGTAYNSDQATRPRWSGFHDNDSPAANATWEDWEKWYQRHSRDAQTPVYTSNGGFITLVAFVVVFSAFSQASRVDEHQQFFADRVELVHNDCSKNIQQRKTDTRELSGTEQAILRFMRSREQGGIPAGCGTQEPDGSDQEGYLPPER